MKNNIIDYGKNPLVINLNKATLANNNFRRAIWTGEYLQVTLMSISPGCDIGLEVHENVDQVIFVVSGKGISKIGESTVNICKDTAIFIPAGTLHNIINTGKQDLKLYTLYAPPEHPFKTLEKNKLP